MATGGRSDRPELLLEWLQLARCARQYVAVGTWTMPPRLTGYKLCCPSDVETSSAVQYEDSEKSSGMIRREVRSTAKRLPSYRKPHHGPQVPMGFVQEIAPADPWAIEKVGVFDDLRQFSDLPVFGRFSPAFHREKKGPELVTIPPRLASRVL